MTLIEKLTENIIADACYGYSGRQDCMMFKDFIELVKECYDNKSDLVWD